MTQLYCLVAVPGTALYPTRLSSEQEPHNAPERLISRSLSVLRPEAVIALVGTTPHHVDTHDASGDVYDREARGIRTALIGVAWMPLPHPLPPATLCAFCPRDHLERQPESG